MNTKTKNYSVTKNVKELLIALGLELASTHIIKPSAIGDDKAKKFSNFLTIITLHLILEIIQTCLQFQLRNGKSNRLFV